MNANRQAVGGFRTLGDTGSTERVIGDRAVDDPIGIVVIRLAKPCLSDDLLTKTIRDQLAQIRIYIRRTVLELADLNRFHGIRNTDIVEPVYAASGKLHAGKSQHNHSQYTC